MKNPCLDDDPYHPRLLRDLPHAVALGLICVCAVSAEDGMAKIEDPRGKFRLFFAGDICFATTVDGDYCCVTYSHHLQAYKARRLVYVTAAAKHDLMGHVHFVQGDRFHLQAAQRYRAGARIQHGGVLSDSLPPLEREAAHTLAGTVGLMKVRRGRKL